VCVISVPDGVVGGGDLSSGPSSAEAKKKIKKIKKINPKLWSLSVLPLSSSKGLNSNQNRMKLKTHPTFAAALAWDLNAVISGPENPLLSC